MVKVVVNNGQYRITIPKVIVEAKGWSSKTRLMVIMGSEGDLELKEIGEEKRKRGKGGNK